MNRLKYILKRLLLALPVIWAGTTVTWLVIYMGPIDPAAALASDLNPQDDAQYELARERLGLDMPPHEHYLNFMTNMFTFDLGQSWVVYPNTSVEALLTAFLPRTLWLGFWSVVIAVGIGLPLGYYAGLRSNTSADYLASFGGVVWRAMPNFWLAAIVVQILIFSHVIFGVDWETLLIEIDAVTGNPDLSHMQGNPLGLFTEPRDTLAAIKKIAPAALVLGSASMGTEIRIARTAVIETKSEQYVQFARAKGVSGRMIFGKHIFRNTLIPLVPVITSEAFLLIGGSVLVETVFGINGIGKLFFDAAIQGDLPLVATLMFIFIVLLVVINIAQDILYTIIDPRVGYDKRE